MRPKGFSFVELMVVLVIISLSLTLITPSLSRFLRMVELKGAAKKVSGILRYCRSEAVNKGFIYQVLFDSDLRRISVQSKEPSETKKEEEVKKEGDPSKKIYTLPDGIQMRKVDVASIQNGSELPIIEFYPNGGSSGGSLLLEGQSQSSFKIEVHFLTGMVKIMGVESLK
ncbi:MAG: prepilin-type N-terminal cleavage/methylation domain-containing protein [Syntrophaceae bacterium]|nr:prepilin-type N-terminal cleavage/methylation domain-containing protein [Syntrophaceae bacterium]